MRYHDRIPGQRTADAFQNDGGPIIPGWAHWTELGQRALTAKKLAYWLARSFRPKILRTYVVYVTK